LAFLGFWVQQSPNRAARHAGVIEAFHRESNRSKREHLRRQ